MVKTLPPNAVGGVGLILGQGTNISHDLWPKSQNIKQSNSQKRVLAWSTLKGSLKKVEEKNVPMIPGVFGSMGPLYRCSVAQSCLTLRPRGLQHARTATS